MVTPPDFCLYFRRLLSSSSLFIYSALFNDALSFWDYIVANSIIIKKRLNENDVAESGRGLFHGVMLAFAWSN
jgi:hypothetical protein